VLSPATGGQFKEYNDLEKTKNNKKKNEGLNNGFLFTFSSLQGAK
jgi:hypothetical protein